MQFVDEFRDPELAKSLLQRLQKVMEKQPHFYSLVYLISLFRKEHNKRHLVKLN